MRWKKARPMNETSSTMSNTAFSHCFSKARNCSPFSSFLNIAFGKMWNAEHAVWAPNPMLNAATPVYAVSSTVALTSSFWKRSLSCCRAVRKVVDFPDPAEPPRYDRIKGTF